jgi:hypothetical protein
MYNGDFDLILSLGGQRRQQTKGKTRRGGKPAARRSPGDRAYGIEHRDVLVFDARDRPGTVPLEPKSQGACQAAKRLKGLVGRYESANRRTAAALALILNPASEENCLFARRRHERIGKVLLLA